MCSSDLRFRTVDVPGTATGAPDDVVAIDHDHDGRDAFLVLAGAGWPAPLQLIEAVRR